jgi:anti-sigma factor RsiW
MSSRIPDTHAEAWALLPWLANGRIQASDREWVEAHVAVCAECRAEVAAQRMMSTAMNAAPRPGNGHRRAAFVQPQWARIEASDPPRRPASRRVRLDALLAPVWLAAAVVIRVFGLALGASLRRTFW